MATVPVVSKSASDQESDPVLSPIQHTLFISYAKDDAAWVDGYLLHALTNAGLEVHTEEAFALGEPRLLAFEKAILSSRYTLLVLSPAYLLDEFSQFIELMASHFGGETGTWPVIPLVYREVSLPPRLAMLTSVDASRQELWEQAVARLVEFLGRPAPAPARPPASPYPGMAAFAEAQSPLFFGRTKELEDLQLLLYSFPFVTLIGPSGSGKSSLVYAGLIPALRRSRRFGQGDWLVRDLRPGTQPIAALRTALGGEFSDALAETVAALLERESADRLLLFVDQFEEIFTVAQDGQEEFQQTLLRLIDQPLVYVMLTVRADFYPNLMGSLLWSTLEEHLVPVLPLRETELAQAIRRPAEEVGVYVEAALVERLVADAGHEPGILPFVQETMNLLWNKVERRFLPLRAYETLVLPRSAYGARTPAETSGLRTAIALKAESVLSGLGDGEKAIARRIFLRLIHFGEGRPPTRRQQTTAQLRTRDEDADLFHSTLYHLAAADSRLLILGGDPRREGDGTVDIAHEALIEAWPRLQEWLSERSDAERERRRLEERAEAWLSLERKGGLLDEVELVTAERWLRGPDAVDLGSSQILQEFVRASRSAVDAARAYTEAVRQRELTLLHRALMRTRLATVASVLLLLALGLAGLLGIRWGNTARAQLITEMRRLVGLSLHHAPDNPALAANLAWRAAPRENDPKPYLADGEFALSYAMQVDLEEEYRKITSLSFLTAKQFAWQEDRLAVGGDGVAIVTFDPFTIEHILGAPEGEDKRPFVQEVLWSNSGALFARTLNTVYVWQNGQEYSHTFRGQVGCAAWQPDADRVAICADSGLRLWSYKDDVLGEVHSFSELVEFVAWSPDGKWLSGWNRRADDREEQELLIWSAVTQQPFVHIRTRFGAHMVGIAWSPDSGHVVGIAANGELRIWNPGDAHEGNPLKLTAQGDNVEFVDDEHFITWGTADLPRLWSVIEAEPIRQFVGDFDFVQGIRIDQDQRRLLTLYTDATAELWEIDTGRRLDDLSVHKKIISAVSWRGSYMATGDNEGVIYISELEEKGEEFTFSALLALRRHEGGQATGRSEVYGLRWLDDRRLLSYGEDGTVRIWRVFDELGLPLCAGSDTDDLLRCFNRSRTLIKDSSGLQSAQWLGDRSVLAVNRDGASRWIAWSDDRKPAETVQTVASLFTSCWEAQRLVLWRTDGERGLNYLNKVDLDSLTDLAECTAPAAHVGVLLNKQGATVQTIAGPVQFAIWLDRRLLMQTAEGTLGLYSGETGELEITLVADMEPVTAAALSPDGRLAVADALGRIHLWEADSGAAVIVLDGDRSVEDPNPITHLEWSVDGERILASGIQVALWHVARGSVITYDVPPSLQLRAALSRDEGPLLLAVANGAMLSVYDALSGQQLPDNLLHNNQIREVQWLTGPRWQYTERLPSPLGNLVRWVGGAAWRHTEERRLLLTRSGDGTVRLWDWEQRSEIMRLHDTGPVGIAVPHPQDGRILVAGRSGVLRAWETWIYRPQALVDLATQEVMQHPLSAEQEDELLPKQ